MGATFRPSANVQRMRIFKNVLYIGAMQVSSILLGIVLMRHVSHTLGAELLGINSFGFAVAGYMALFAQLGISVYGVREIAKCQGDTRLRQQVFSRGITYQAFFTGIVLVVFVTWACLYPDGNSRYYLLFTLTILSYMTDLTWFYGGIERYDKISLRIVTSRLVGTLAIIFLVTTPQHLARMIAIQQGALLLSNLFFWLPLRHYGIRVRLAPLAETLKTMLRPCLAVFLPILIIGAFDTLDKVILGLLATKQEVAIYDYPARLARVGTIIAGVLGNVMIPRLASLWGQHSREVFTQALHDQIFYGLLIGVLISGGIYITAEPTCNILLDDSFQGSGAVLSILSLSVFPVGMGLYHCAMAIGRERQLSRPLLALSVTAVGLYALTTHLYGSRGLAVTFVAMVFLCNTLYAYTLRDVLNFQALFGHLARLLLFAMIAIAAAWFIRPDNPFMAFVLRGGAFAATYCLLAYLRYPKIGLWLRDLLAQMAKRKSNTGTTSKSQP